MDEEEDSLILILTGEADFQLIMVDKESIQVLMNIG